MFVLFVFIGLLSWVLVATVVIAFIFAWKVVLAAACLLLAVLLVRRERPGVQRRRR